MKLSIFCPFGLKTPIHAPKLGVFGGFHPQNRVAMSTKPPKGTSAGRNGSSGVLIMSLSVIVPEKSCGNKVWQRRRTNFWPFGIAVEWP